MDDASFAASRMDNMDFPGGFRTGGTRTHYQHNKMFVGGLPYDLSKEAFFQYLSQLGKVIDFVIKTDPITDRPRGFGFVVFEDSATVQKVLQMKEHKLGGKKIQFKMARPLEYPSEKRKIFVGGLSPLVSEGEIREYFGTFGQIEHVHLPVWAGTDKRRDFGIIRYADAGSAQKVLATRYHLIGSSRCEVKVFESANPRVPRQLGSATGSCGLRDQLAGAGSFQASEAEANEYGASQAAKADPNGFSSNPVPVPLAAPTVGSAFSHVNGKLHNIRNDQPAFPGYGGNYCIGYNNGTFQHHPPCPICNMPINQDTCADGGFQRSYRLF